MLTMLGRESSKWAHAHSSLEPGQFTSLALTHVQFYPDDPLSMPLALITLAPPFLLASYVSILLVRRELTVLLAFIGQIGCEMVNLALKRTFKQGRPTDFLGTGYGMPSSHSQFCGYFVAFWACHLLRFRPGMSRRERKRQDGRAAWTFVDMLRSLEHYALLSLIVIGMAAVPYSRYHLAYHSVPQIFVGLGAGLACGLGWYYLVEVLSRVPFGADDRSLRDILLDNPVLVAFRIRDSWSVWDDAGIEAEYGLWRRVREQMRQESLGRQQQSQTTQEDVKHMLHALRLADQCEETTTAFSVGCVITDRQTGEVLATGYSREEPGNTHAEEVALNKLMAGSTQVKGGPDAPHELNLYTTMEPCGERLSKKAPCAERIVAFNEARFALNTSKDKRPMRIVVVWQGVGEPGDFIAQAEGTKQLQRRGGGLMVSTIDPGNTFTHPQQAQSTLTLQPGWLGHEAVRLAKKGHPDQPKADGENEIRVWREEGWVATSVPKAHNRAHRHGASISLTTSDANGVANALQRDKGSR